MRGAIDYIIVGFEGNHFNGEILKELEKAHDNGVIDVLSIALISRGTDGTVAAVSVTDPTLQEILAKLKVEPNLISQEDIDEVGGLLEDGTSAGLLIIEHLWSRGLKQAITNAHGTLLLDGRIHPDASDELSSKEG